MDSLFFVVHVPRALVLVRERRQRGDQREHVHRVQLLVCGRCGAYDGPGGLLFCRDRFVPFDVFVDAGDVHEDFEQNGRGGERERGREGEGRCSLLLVLYTTTLGVGKQQRDTQEPSCSLSFSPLSLSPHLVPSARSTPLYGWPCYTPAAQALPATPPDTDRGKALHAPPRAAAARARSRGKPEWTCPPPRRGWGRGRRLSGDSGSRGNPPACSLSGTAVGRRWMPPGRQGSILAPVLIGCF